MEPADFMIRRIGGLEKQDSLSACVRRMIRRIGGLEIKVKSDASGIEMIRRIGGLENAAQR